MNLSLLVDLIPAAARKYVYAILTLASVVYGIWQATGGSWDQFAASVVTAVVGALATANTNVKTLEPPSDEDYPVDDDGQEPAPEIR